MSDKKTCGALYQKALTIGMEMTTWSFSAGFLTGQMEKVYLGACRACMTKDMELLPFAKRLAVEVYAGLQVSDIRTEDHCVNSDELWVYRGSTSELLPFLSLVPDTPQWHLSRAALCGIPASEIDLEFHRRYQSQ